MKILIDSADINEIKRLYELYPIDGVTCNPTILKRCGKQPYEALLEIREFIGLNSDLHVQVVSQNADEMVREGHKIQEVLGETTYIKIPVIPQGIKAIGILAREGANVTGTAIYNQMQGYIAGKAGAKYVAPYVNRIDNMGYDGVKVAKDIHDMLKNAGLDTSLLAASFRNSQQVIELAKFGAGATTISPDIIDGLIKLDATNITVDTFIKDFDDLCECHSTMENSK